jgi:hypothetical protein
MADTVIMTQYFKMQVPDKPGEAARVLGTFKAAGVNLLGFSGFPRNRRGQLDFVPEHAEQFKQAAQQARIKLAGAKTCFVVNGDDRPGAVADVLGTLAAAKINVTAMDAVCSGQGRYGALLWVKPKDVKKAAKALGIG